MRWRWVAPTMRLQAKWWELPSTTELGITVLPHGVWVLLPSHDLSTIYVYTAKATHIVEENQGIGENGFLPPPIITLQIALFVGAGLDCMSHLTLAST